MSVHGLEMREVNVVRDHERSQFQRKYEGQLRKIFSDIHCKEGY